MSNRIMSRKMAYEISKEEAGRIAGGLMVNTFGPGGTNPSMCFVGMHGAGVEMYDIDDCSPDADLS